LTTVLTVLTTVLTVLTMLTTEPAEADTDVQEHMKGMSAELRYYCITAMCVIRHICVISVRTKAIVRMVSTLKFGTSTHGNGL
jgi:hypothetical protein